MTDYNATHYDIDHEQRGKQMIVLDAFRGMAEVIDNDVIAQSKTKPLQSGIENPASTLNSSGNVYTTIPLKPLEKYVNFLFEDYINIDFEFTMNVTASADITGLPYILAVYFPCAACIPSRLQLMCGNSIIWTNQFQRYEALVSMASIKASYLDKDEQYVSINKLLRHEEIPGVYIPLSTLGAATTAQNITFTINCNIDLNQLSPIFSNIPFVTTDMGDLRLRLFFERMSEALCVTPIPIDRFNTNVFKGQTATIQRIPFVNGTVISLPTLQVSGTPAVPTAPKLTLNSLTWKAINAGVQICQTCFDVAEYSRVAIAKYIGEDNKLAIPTQTWSTVQATTNPTTNGDTIFQVSAYNIALIAFIFPFIDNTEVCLPNPFMSNVDVKLNSKSLTYIPYSTIDYRTLKDTAQAFLNNDKYAFNDVLKNSLIPGMFSSIDYSVDDNVTNYMVPIFNGAGQRSYSNLWLDDNNFCFALGLEPPNCFEKGYCVASSNPQSTQVRVNYAIKDVRTKLSYQAVVNKSDSLTNGQFAMNYNNSTKPAFCLALQDCLVVLDYNPITGTCMSGCIQYAEPAVV